MKTKILLFATVIIMAFVGCSKDADDSANSSAGFKGNEINGTWKETKSGFIVKISGVSGSALGNGVVLATGTAFPAGAKGGTCMKEVEHISGGYWNAYYYNYFDNGTWKQSGVIGMAMNDAGKEFKIGSAVYVKQP
nr:hypothetical protein [Pseudopedobacter sp.]